MSTPDLKILFIGHDATRTGAPKLLFNLLSYAKERKKSTIRILLRNSGPLAGEFRQIAPTKTYFIQGRTQALTNLLRLNRLAQSFRIKILLRQYKKEKFDLIYSNTIVNGDVLQALSELNCPVVTHVHELGTIIDSFGEENWELVKQHTDHFIAGSNAVQEHLVSGRGVAREKIDVVHEFVPAFPEISIPDSRNEIRNRLGIPLNAFLVCGSGVCEHRKGTDLFVRLAERMQGRNGAADIYFLWVGGWPRIPKGRPDLEDFLDRKGLRGRVFFTGEVEDPLDYYAAADVFTLVSREDPFPLVCLLAASVGKPVLCFDKAGGMPEFVGDDCGYVVPYLDLEAFAERIFYLIDNPEELHRLGSAAREKVRRGYDTAVGAERIFRIIDKVLSDPNRGKPV